MAPNTRYMAFECTRYIASGIRWGEYLGKFQLEPAFICLLLLPQRWNLDKRTRARRCNTLDFLRLSLSIYITLVVSHRWRPIRRAGSRHDLSHQVFMVRIIVVPQKRQLSDLLAFHTINTIKDCSMRITTVHIFFYGRSPLGRGGQSWLASLA